MESDSFTGSSHRRTRSDYQPPTTDQFSEHRYGVNGFLVSPRGPVTSAAAAAPPPPTANATSSYAAQPLSNFNNIRK